MPITLAGHPAAPGAGDGKCKLRPTLTGSTSPYQARIPVIERPHRSRKSDKQIVQHQQLVSLALFENQFKFARIAAIESAWAAAQRSTATLLAAPTPCSPHPHHAASFTCLPASACRSGHHDCAAAGGGAWCSARLDGDQWLRWGGGCDRGQRVLHSVRLYRHRRRWLLRHGFR